jgi:large subunit ribosomal protein L24
MKKIRKGDKVVVLAGRDKGMQGTVLRVLDDERVLVESVNVIKRHTKPNPNKGVTGGIIDKEAPIHVSNIALYNPATSKGERVGMRIMKDGNKVRYFKKSGEVADVK